MLSSLEDNDDIIMYDYSYVSDYFATICICIMVSLHHSKIAIIIQPANKFIFGGGLSLSALIEICSLKKVDGDGLVWCGQCSGQVVASGRCRRRRSYRYRDSSRGRGLSWLQVKCNNSNSHHHHHHLWPGNDDDNGNGNFPCSCPFIIVGSCSCAGTYILLSLLHPYPRNFASCKKFAKGSAPLYYMYYYGCFYARETMTMNDDNKH